MHFPLYLATIQIDGGTALTAVMAITGLASLFGAGILFAVKAIVRKEIAEFLVTLNGTYLRTKLADAEFRRIDDRLDMIHGRQSSSRSNHPAVGR